MDYEILSLITSANTYKIILKYCIGPLSGAFTGSYLAYRLAIRRENKKQEAERINAAQEALFILTYQVNTIAVFKKQILSKHYDSPFRHFEIPTIEMQDHKNLNVNFSSISFILSSKYKEMLGRIMVSNDYFHSLIGAIHKRNGTHSEYQQIISISGVKHGSTLTNEEAIKIAGSRLPNELKSITDAIYEMTDSHITSTTKLVDEFATILEKIYPNSKFIRFVVDPLYL